jgi:hypothetical protein
MRQTICILIILLISINGFSQCDDIEKLEMGGTHSSKTHNYLYFKAIDKDKIYYENIAYPIDIKKIEKYSDFILKKAEEYIIDRANADFFNKLEIYQVEVNYDESIKVSYLNEDLFELSNYPTHTYWVIYDYLNNGIKYGFGLEFDKDGKMISENKFPDFSLNPEFAKLNEPCLALEKVKSDERFKDKKVDFIELAYIDDINSFCWLIQEDYNVSKKQDIEFEKWYEYSEQSYYVNVNTNKIEKIEDKKKQVVYCGYKLTKKTKD